MMQLFRREVIVLNGIARTINLGVFKTFYLTQGLILNIIRERGAESVEVVFLGGPAFGLHKELMAVFTGKTLDFIFYTRTIPWTHALNTAIEHRRVFEALTKRFVYFERGMRNPTASLLGDLERLGIGEPDHILVALLLNKFAEIDGSTIDTDWCTRFQAFRLKTAFLQLFRDAVTGHFSHPATREVLLTNMYQTIEESTIGENDRLALNLAAHHRLDAFDLVTFDEQSHHSILPKVKIRGLFKHAAPFGGEHHLVALATRAPHGRAFRLVQHPELDHGAVADDTGITTHGIDFADDLSLGNATHSRVTRHGGHQTQIHGDKQDLAAHIGRCRCGLTPGVTGAYNNDIIGFKIHLSFSVSRETIYILI